MDKWIGHKLSPLLRRACKPTSRHFLLCIFSLSLLPSLAVFLSSNFCGEDFVVNAEILLTSCLIDFQDWQWISEYSQKNQHIFGKNFSFLDFREQYGRISLCVPPKICNTKWKINLSSWRFFSEFIVCVGPESVAGIPVVTSNMGTMSSPAQFLSWLLVAPDVQMYADVLNYNVFIVLSSEFAMTYYFEFY